MVIHALCLTCGTYTGHAWAQPNWPPSLHGKIEPLLAYESNYSVVLNRQVAFSGYGLGFEWESGTGLAIVYNTMDSRIFTPKYSPLGQLWQVRFHYFSLDGYQTLFDGHKASLALSMGIGSGWVRFAYRDAFVSRHRAICLEPSLNPTYRILPWLSLTSQVGYRLAMVGGAPSGPSFSSLKMNIGFSIAPLPFLEAVKNKNLIN